MIDGRYPYDHDRDYDEDDRDFLEGHSGDCAWCGYTSRGLDEYLEHDRSCPEQPQTKVDAPA